MDVVFVNFKTDMALLIDQVLLKDSESFHGHFVPLSQDFVDIVEETNPSVIVCGFDYGAEVRETPDLCFVINIWKERYSDKMMVLFAKEPLEVPEAFANEPNIVIMDSWMNQKQLGKVLENLAKENTISH